jgi:hypothetical protein
MVKGLNLETFRVSHVHINDLRVIERPDLSTFALNEYVLEDVLQELSENVSGYSRLSENWREKSWNNKMIFVDVDNCVDYQEIFAKALKERPSRLMIVIPEWRECAFWYIHELIKGEFISVPEEDPASFLSNGEPAGLLAWKSWVGFFTGKALQDASETPVIRKLLGASACGEVLKLARPDLDLTERNADARADTGA